jgi:serine protease AprX
MRDSVKRKLSFLPVFVTILLLAVFVFSAMDEKKQEKKAKPVPRQVERAGWELGKIAPAVTNMAKIQDMVDVVVYFKGKPRPEVKRIIEKRHMPKIEAVRSKIKTLLQKAKKIEPGEKKPDIEQHEREVKYLPQMEKKLSKADEKQLKDLRKTLDAETKRMRISLLGEVRKANETYLSRFESSIKKLGGKVKVKAISQNALGITIPSANLKKLAEDPDVVEITPDVKAELELNTSVPALGTSSFWTSGYDGGVWDIGIVDLGAADDTHTAISSHDFYGDTSCGSHATHIAGIVASTNSTYKGVAYGCDAIISKIASTESVVPGAFTWILDSSPDDADVANMSMGFGYATSDDDSFSQRFDGWVDNYNLPITKSAGNMGDGTTTITRPGNSYNIFVVGNMNNQNTTTVSDDEIWPSSSRGPTDGGRKKPDLVAPGREIYSTLCGGGWGNKTGTSMAAPHVAGACLLLLDSGVYYPIAMKAILINTARSWDIDTDTETSGSVWNKTYGWGYLWLWHANYHRDDYFMDIVYPKNSGNDFKFYKGRNYTNDKVTLVWNRHIDSFTSTAYDLNDLDLYLFDETTNTEVDRSWSAIDNVEQVSGQALNAVVKVEAWDTSFEGVTYERYAVATEENFSKATPPSFTIVASAGNPTVVTPFFSTIFTYTITNTGDITAHNVQVNLSSSGLADIWGPSSNGFDLAPGASQTVSWGKMGFISGSHSIVATATSNSYYEWFFGSQESTITIL